MRDTTLIDSVAEEITMYLGLKTKITKNKIEVDTVAGVIKLSVIFPTIMENVYRFIYVYGGRLHEYGLKKRIEESKLNQLKQ